MIRNGALNPKYDEARRADSDVWKPIGVWLATDRVRRRHSVPAKEGEREESKEASQTVHAFLAIIFGLVAVMFVILMMIKRHDTRLEEMTACVATAPDPNSVVCGPGSDESGITARCPPRPQGPPCSTAISGWVGIVACLLGLAWWFFHEMRSESLTEKTAALGTGPLSLASILVGVGALCVRMFLREPTDLADESLGPVALDLVGFLAVSAGALLVDSIMDQNLKLSFWQRLIFLNGGYMTFCAVIAFVSVILVNDALGAGSKNDPFALNQCEPWIIGLCLFGKVMAKDDRGFFLLALVLTSIYAWASVFSSGAPLTFGIEYYWVLVLSGVPSFVAWFWWRRRCDAMIEPISD